MTVVLEDCGGTLALGGSIGQWLKIASAALGGSGGRRTCNDGVGISVVKAKGVSIMTLVSVLARMAREDASYAKEVN